MANQEQDMAVQISTSAAAEDFEFRILSSGGLVPAGEAAANMCAADEVFSHGKLLPLRPSSATAADASGLLLRSESGSDSAASTAGFSSRSDSRSASSSSSGCVSRSPSSKSAASSDAAPVPAPPRRSLSSNLFYAHPSPSPQLRAPPPRRGATVAAARRSTGSAPPAAWGLIRLGVAPAPDVYPPRAADAKKAAAAKGGSGHSRSARFEQASSAKAAAMDKKLAVGLLGGGLGCSCSPDAVEPVSSLEAAAAAARRRKKREEQKKGGVKRAQGVCRSRILEWLEELAIAKEKNGV